MPLFVRPDAGPVAAVTARCELPPAEALAVIAELPLPGLFLRWGPFPAVRAVEGQEGRWDHLGATRSIHFSDGGHTTETIVEHRPGDRFAYELTGFTDVFRFIVVGVRGQWAVRPSDGGSIVRWSWEFQPLPGRRALVRFAIVPLWRVAMRGIMRRTIAEAEGGTR